MKTILRWLASLFAILPLALFTAVAVAEDSAIAVQRVTGEFQDLRDRVVFAIEQQGLSIAHTSKVGAMLNRTAKDLGVATQTYADAEVIEFCSSVVSRDVTAVDPRYVALCPYAITVYTLVAEPGAVYVAYRRLIAPGASEAVVAALARAESLLAAIVRAALE
ncbi:MAG: DUF302 domain-containing protein [Burkholderiales bacterium]